MGPVDGCEREIVIATRSPALFRAALLLCWIVGTAGCHEPASRSPRERADAARDARPDVRVIDGDTLDVDGQRHRLFGIDAPEADRLCDDRDGSVWRCGEAATERLRELATDAPVTCQEVEGERDGYGRLISRCAVEGIDLASLLVEEGFAWAYVTYSREQMPAEARARRAGLGVWRGANPPAWEMRAQRRRVAAAARAPERPPVPDCAIKGNRSSTGLIYHLPGSRDYADTRIDVRRGERWFCSEAEALAAGWRARRR